MAKALRKHCRVTAEADLNERLRTSGLTNPSVLADPVTGDLHVIAKSVGFDREQIWLRGDWDAMLDSGGRIAIRHLYLRLTPGFDVIAQRPLVFQDLADEDGRFDTADDVRLITWKQQLMLVGSCLKSVTGRRNGAWRRLGPTTTRMFLAPLAPGADGREGLAVGPASVLRPFFADAVADKNWITHEHNPDGLLLCVDINRGLWIKLDDASQAAARMPLHGLVWRGGWSGNSNVVAANGLHIGLLHRKSESSPCVYNHMFVVCDRQFTVIRRSEPFSFEDQAVEFSVGLTIDRRSDDLVIAYGVWDREAKLIRIGVSEVDAFCRIAVSDANDLYAVPCDALAFYRDNPALVSSAHGGLAGTVHQARRELLAATAPGARRSGSIQYWRKGEAVQNFGDFLSAYLAERLFRSVHQTPYNVHVIGSVISDHWVAMATRQVAQGGADPALVAVFWGCGLREPLGPGQQGLSRPSLDRISVRAVRGPLSARELGLPQDFPQGDPALLMPLLYQPRLAAEYRGRTVVVPHFEDTRPDPELRSRAGAEMVLRPNIPGALDEIELFVDRLCSSRFVLTGSLHAAIIAAAYRIPFAFWDSGNINIPFKWRDFAASINVPCEFQPDIAAAIRHHDGEIAPRLRLPDLGPLLSASPFEVRRDVLARAARQDARPQPSAR